MKLKIVPPRQGAQWVRQGVAIFLKQPLVYAGLFAAFMCAVLLCSMLQPIGTFLALALLPVATLVFMVVTQRAVATGDAKPATLLAGHPTVDRSKRIALLQLGVIYAVATLGITALSEIVDGGAFEAFMKALPTLQKSPGGVEAALANPRLAMGLMILAGLASLLSVPFWHAPALVYWGNLGCAQALFSSTVVCWRNRWAFVMYSLTWMALIMLLAMIGSMVFALMGLTQVFALAATPLSLILTTMFYASLYFTFTDCIDLSTESTPPA